MNCLIRFRLVLGLAAGAALVGLDVPAQPSTPALAREFPPGALERLEQLPAGRFRSEVEQLPGPARERALGWLRGFHFPAADVASLHVDANGGIGYACSFTLPATTEPVPADEPPAVAFAAAPISPFPTNLIFHSRPGAPNVLFLEFSGMTVTNTEWNTEVGRASIPALPFSTDADYTTFSEAEQVAIKRIWQRMAEDYAPFNIDVTTERPATFNNRTAVALITRSTDANGQPNPYDFAGGVAYVNVFNASLSGGYARYRPAWVYHNNLANNESYIAEAASHEIGHNLGLSHDGRTNGEEYYGGHGSGDISWGPLMGTGYDRNVSQWSRGEYYLANNTQDDLATIAGKISYRTDDHGNTPGTATAMVLTGGTNIVSTTPENDPANTNPANKGVLTTTNDVDVFSFVTGSGMVRLAVHPWIQPAGSRGGNLDVLLQLYNDSGVLLATNNPATTTTALLQTNLTAGVYYLHLRNSGAGNPLSASPSGYTPYGSLGQYFLSGHVTDPSGLVVPPVAELSITDLTEAGQSTKPFTVTYSDNVAINVATLDGNDLRVTGPNGYDQLAQFVSVNTSGNGTPRTATYASAPAGGGNWRPADNGTYTIFMRSNQVANTEGAFVAAGQLGQFNVAVPVVVYSANLSVNPGWTLEPDWQYGTPNYGGSGPSGGYTGTQIIGYNLGGNYPNGLAVKYATTPPINAAGSSALTLRFRRWLGLRDIDSALIQASTNGVNWIQVWSSAGASISDNAWQLVQYSLPASVAGSASLRLRWALSSGGTGGRPTRIGWNLDDIELLASGVLDTDPPVPALSVANLTQGGSPNHSCSVTYTDATAVKLSSLTSSNLLVTGPNNFSNLCEFVGADLPGDGSPLTGSYAIPAPGGAWDAADNGAYSLTLLADTVTDTLNNAVAHTNLGTFTVAISTATPGVLGVLPLGDLVSSGTTGGPFTPSSLIYTLTNSGGSTLNWTASKTADWVSLSATNGSLATGATATVTVSLNAAVEDLPAGSYGDTVSFANLTSGAGNTTRAVSLEISGLPATVELALTVNQPAWGAVSPTNGAYPVGTPLELLATPATYFAFAGWTGDVTGTNNPFPLVLETNLTAQAAFAEIFTTNHPTPLWWLAQYGVTNDFETAVDTVGANGYPLWQSYVAGLDPANAASQLRLDAVPGAVAGEWVLTWTPVAGRLYTLTVATNEPLGFVPLPDATDLPATVAAYTNQLAPDVPARFHRLEVRKP
mgnify:CR=1 FL=1